MAPRAGFESERKFLSAHVVPRSEELDTPSDTPPLARLIVRSVSRCREHHQYVGPALRLTDLFSMSDERTQLVLVEHAPTASFPPGR